MPSTNKTDTLSLSQFSGTDVPDWIQDYNKDMLKIDAAVASKETPAGAQTKADLAETNAKNASLPRTGGNITGNVFQEGRHVFKRTDSTFNKYISLYTDGTSFVKEIYNGDADYPNRREFYNVGKALPVDQAILFRDIENGVLVANYRIYGEHFKPCITGTYTGDGAASRDISLGFTPSRAFVTSNSDAHATAIEPTASGFRVTGIFNTLNEVYYYTLFR